MADQFFPDDLHRLIKLDLDNGTAASVEEAESIFRSYRVAFRIGAGKAEDPACQAAMLTGIALARRVFLGGVSVDGSLDVPLAVPLPLGASLREAAASLGAIEAVGLDDGVPTVWIGGGPHPAGSGFAIRTECAGWRGGIVPAHAQQRCVGGEAMPLAAMLAAGLAVNEVFLHLRGESALAGRRAVGLSLWMPGSPSWLEASADEPALSFLPVRLWLIGLGHLGQAYLWALGLLPYARPGELELVLQDIDVITLSSESTSILSDASMVGRKKTRAMAAWAERRGFSAAIHERLFDASFKVQEEEPPIALCGLDNGLGRRALDQVGFRLVVEAGLGRGYRDFRTMRLHTLPAGRPAADIWPEGAGGEDLSHQPAYRKLLGDGTLDRCGATQLAGKAVGAPFVGVVAASLAIAEVLRLLHGGAMTQVADLDLSDLAYRSVVARSDDAAFNPGFTDVQVKRAANFDAD